MSLAIFLVFLILKTAQSAEDIPKTSFISSNDGPRTARQLDIGVQEITYTNDKIIDSVPKGNARSKPKLDSERGYLPPKIELAPIIAAGAQNDETIVETTTEVHSHPFHHGRDLCTDPFHSFLCQKPKPRKRITGALPPNLSQKYALNGNLLIGANSFPKPSKILAPPDNYIQNAVPKLKTTTTDQYTTTQPPSRTTQEIYTTTGAYYTTIPTTQSVYSEPPTTVLITTLKSFTQPTTRKTFNSEPSFLASPSADHFRSYIPPPVPQPSNENKRLYSPPKTEFDTAAAQENAAIAKPTEEPHRDFCSDPFHSFYCTPLKKRVRITGALPSNVVAQNNFAQSRRVEVLTTPRTVNLVPAPSIENLRREPLFENILVNPSNLTRDYLPPRIISTVPPTTTTSKTTTTRTTTTTTLRPPTTTKETQSIINIPEPSNDAERAYLPPRLTRPVVNQKYLSPVVPESSKEVEIIFLPTTKITTIVPKPTTVQPFSNLLGYVPQKPGYETAAAHNDVTFVEPTFKNTDKDICSNNFHSYLCEPSRKDLRLTGARSSSRINTDKSRLSLQRVPPQTTSKKVDLYPPRTTNRSPTRYYSFRQNSVLQRPTNTYNGTYISRSTYRPELVTVTPRNSKQTSIIQYDRKEHSPSDQIEIIYQKEEAQDPDYSYSKPLPEFQFSSKNNRSYKKPDVDYPLPTDREQSVEFPSETGYSYPRPDVESIDNNKGYKYPKPEKQMPLSTTQKYEYPKPEKRLQLPSEQGVKYEYPKPEKELTLPTNENGYEYQKPDVEFISPTEGNGYNYEKPEIRFPPTRERRIANSGQDKNPWIPIIPQSPNKREEVRRKENSFGKARNIPTKIRVKFGRGFEK